LQSTTIVSGSGVTEQDKTDIIDGVWNETLSEHVTSGSTGNALDNMSGGSSPDTIAAAVWDKATTDHTDAGSFGENLTDRDLTAAAVWDKKMSDHVEVGTFGEDLATVSDIHSSAATSIITYSGGSIIYGNLYSGTIANTIIRDNNHWIIQEDDTTGLTVEFTFNLATVEQRAGLFNVFGHYDGKGGTHYMELWAWHVEAGVWELLHEEFMTKVKDNVDIEHSHVYAEHNIDRDNDNEVKIRLVHNTTGYRDDHELYIDSCSVTAIDVVTAADIADAVWDEPTSEHVNSGSFGEKVGKLLTKIQSLYYK